MGSAGQSPTRVYDPEAARGSGRIVDDFSPFCEGDRDPSLNKIIGTLIDADSSYLVYLDEEDFVQWSLAASYNLPDRYGEITNRMRRLETLSLSVLHPTQRQLFAGLLAEGMARILGDRSETAAHAVLDEAESYLAARGSENARLWYLYGSGFVAMTAAVFAFACWLLRARLQAALGVTCFEVALGGSLGMVGALFSILLRSQHITVNAEAGPRVHVVEGAARALAGGAAALMLALSIKSNLVLGFSRSASNALPALLAACFAAGASERLVPTLIRRMANHASADPRAGQGTG